ncbi:MAG: hypothetical protein WD005_05690, partial [Haliea sp.]
DGLKSAGRSRAPDTGRAALSRLTWAEGPVERLRRILGKRDGLAEKLQDFRIVTQDVLCLGANIVENFAASQEYVLTENF